MIVQICLNFFGSGAIMNRAREEVSALLNEGYKVVVITDIKNKKYLNLFKQFSDKLIVVPIQLIRLPGPFHTIFNELSFTFQTYLVLKQLSIKNPIQLIVCHTMTTCYAVVKISHKNNIPNVLVVQGLIKDRIATGNPYNWWTTQLYKHSNRYALLNMNYIIAVSKYMKELAIIEGTKPNKIFLSHNSVDRQLFHPNREIEKDIDIIFIGRLSIEKGVNILLDAVQYLSTKRKILIIGDGPLRKYLEQKSKNLKHNIEFLGWIEHELLPQYIQRAKLLVAPSLSEAHAAVPLEAMACGVPVIASKVGGMADTIQHDKNGWLLKENNSKTLGILIEKVLSDEKKLEIMGQFAYKRTENFSKTKFRQNIVQLYNNLM